MKRLFTVWYHSTMASAQSAFASRLGVILFTIGKLLRFFFFVIFILLIFGRTKHMGGYTIWEIIFFYATFNVIDIFPQMLLRSVYRFRSLVVSGDFDLFFLKPISPLFMALFGGSDILDIPMLFLSIGFIFYSGLYIPVFSLSTVFLYTFLLLNAFLIATSFHIFVLSIGIATTEVDNTIMLYRDLTQMGRLPVDIYKQGVNFLLTFVIPVGVMITFPVKALLGTLSIQFILYSFLFGALFFLASLWAWRTSLRSYTSASS